jgi:hypothetical protein
MAASGYTPIQLYYSSTATNIPIAGNLVNGELAINIADEKLYFKNSSGTVKLLASSASTTNVSSISFGSTGLTPATATTGAVTVAGTLGATNGGTAQSTYTTGDLLYASASNTLSKLGIGSSGQVLTVSAGVPAWASAGSVSLTVGTTAISSGTSGYILYNNAGVLGNLANTGTGNNVLATSPTFTTPVLGTPTSGTLTNCTGYTTANLSGSISLTTQVSGTLPVANGGTGVASATAYALLAGGTTSTGAFQSLASVGTSGQVLTSNGAGALPTFQSPAGGSLTVGTTTIASGTSGYILYNNAGVLGNLVNTGTGNNVLATSPTLTTPTLGVATATSINKVAFTAPATGSTLTIADGKTLTANNSLTLAGTDATTMTFPSSSATVAGLGITQTFTAQQTFSGSSSVISSVFANSAEVATISATAATGTINYDVTTQSVLYYTTNASANWTVNFRASSGTSLNTALATGQSVTVAFLVAQGGTAYYNSAVQVDGSAVTPKWQGGTAPTSGNTSSIDVYQYTIVKTASATFTVFASQTKYA